MAFTAFGIENLIDLIKIHKGDRTILAEAIPLNPGCLCLRATADGYFQTDRPEECTEDERPRSSLEYDGIVIYCWNCVGCRARKSWMRPAEALKSLDCRHRP